MKKISYWIVCSLLLLAASPAVAQTFEIGGKSTATPPPAVNKNGKASPAAAGKKKSGKSAKGGAASSGAPSSGGLGWGASIDVTRDARAAEQAIKHKDPAAATMYAQRAVNKAPQNPNLWFLLGYTARLSGRYGQSVQAYQKGLSLKAGSAEGLSGLAQTYAKMGRRDDAKRLLAQAIAAAPKNVTNILVLGEIQIQSGEFQQGIATLERAESIKPSSHSELLMAVAYMKLKQMEKAKVLLARAKARDPKNVAIFRAVANFQREEKDYKSAIATLKSAPRMSPEVLADLGYTYELADMPKDSAAAYERAAKAAPAQIGYQLSAAQAVLRTGDPDKAKQYLARATQIDADHYRLHAIRGAMAKAENRPDEAIREYQFALAHLPEGGAPEGQMYPVLLRLNLSELFKQTGNEAAAKSQLAMAEQEISKIHVEGPQMAEFLRVRASIKLGAGDFAGAEADLKQALKLDPANTNAALGLASVYWKAKRTGEAQKIYADVLAQDPKNRFALESLGYLARELGNRAQAEEFFNRLAQAYPDDYVAYLALGDMYTDARDFLRADANYQQAYKRAPKNPIVVANAANAAIEARKFELAKTWVDRATGSMNDDPRVMRERERYLFHTGKYLESAQLGRKVLEKLPRDRNGSVYLGYALYNLGRYDDVLTLTSQYEQVLPKEANFPLLQGHVHKQSQLLDQAVDDYTRAIEKDPKMVEPYVNRGYVRNDLQDPELASQDFNQALKLAPNNGIAHLGLAFSSLQLKRGHVALEEADAAEKLMGESGATHLARATAYRQMRVLDRAEKEYRAALKYSPNDLHLHMALADTLYHARKYNDSIAELDQVLRLQPENAATVYAQMAHAHAQMGHRAETFQYIEAAEREGGGESQVLLATGDALLVLGDEEAAMERFARALQAPDADRVAARLAVAKVFAHKNEYDDAKQQVALAFAESRVGEASPVTDENLIEAANIFLAAHDFKLAEKYYRRAADAGAGEEVVAIGLANTYLAQGQAAQAQAQLAALGNPADYASSYDYQLAAGNMYRQSHDMPRALSAFGRANQLDTQSDVAQRQMYEVAAQEGYQINRRFSVLSDLDVHGIFQPATVYELDAKLFGITDPALMPSPRNPREMVLTNAFRVHQGGLPTISGFFQVRNAKGVSEIPGLGLVLNRDTTDYSFNAAINPVLHFAGESVAINTGVQYTIRRDSDVPVALNQNLLREFLHFSTSSFFNWLAVRGSAYHEAGPFTDRNLNSRDVGGELEFRVGRPWGKTAMITGYSLRDLQFDPLIREYFTTSTWVGVERKFGEKLTVRLLGEYVRAWRVQDNLFATAQMARPAVELHYRANNRWSADGTFALSRGQGFHTYDNMQSSFFISYMKPWRSHVNDGLGEVPVEYPLRFSIGIQQQSFPNFTGRGQSVFRPVIRLTLF
ncbi:MAG: tetratricopeptide repeat protein [Candidatus Koribacter versatilis]|uniref:Tetratricopeptide repeat protein n=1 Tax=Candidatus Korobacter versatilis TaxID=658062 RepID=A0A932ERP2_9BACT|nr:tetratricopeptide repeat protein [Candidatus Koribacter versatilis]